MSDDTSLKNHGALERLRSAGVVFEDSAESNLAQVNQELQMRADPDRVAAKSSRLWPWSREAKARNTAQELSVQARLDIFKDDLRSIRIARPKPRCDDAGCSSCGDRHFRDSMPRRDGAIFDHQPNAAGDDRAIHVQLEAIEGFRGRVTPEILDALKERALTEFSNRMNRASKADFEFSKNDILRIKP